MRHFTDKELLMASFLISILSGIVILLVQFISENKSILNPLSLLALISIEIILILLWKILMK